MRTRSAGVEFRSNQNPEDPKRRPQTERNYRPSKLNWWSSFLGNEAGLGTGCIYPHLYRVLRNNLRAEDSQSVVHQLRVSHVQYHQTFACSGQYVVPPSRPRAAFLVADPFFTKRLNYTVFVSNHSLEITYESCSKPFTYSR